MSNKTRRLILDDFPHTTTVIRGLWTHRGWWPLSSEAKSHYCGDGWPFALCVLHWSTHLLSKSVIMFPRSEKCSSQILKTQSHVLKLCLFRPTSSPELSNSSFTVTNDKDKQQILTFPEQGLAKVRHVCSDNWPKTTNPCTLYPPLILQALPQHTNVTQNRSVSCDSAIIAQLHTTCPWVSGFYRGKTTHLSDVFPEARQWKRLHQHTVALRPWHTLGAPR